MDWIDFRDIPFAAGGISNLFLDYIYDFEKVSHFYKGDFRSEDSLRNKVEEVRGKRLDRSAVAEVLREQNQAIGCGEKCLQNIEKLKENNTFAVVTGQQVGLFTGPIYTVYKAISAIKLADRLNTKFEDCRFVPIFWLEGEDHDFKEMNNITVIGDENNLIDINYWPDGKPTDRNLGPSGEVVIDRYMDTVFAMLDEALMNTEFKADLLASVKNSYSQGANLNEAFARLLGSLLGDSGLVFVNSNHPKLKRLLLPIFRKEFLQYPTTSELVVTQSAILETNYHAQVKVKPINLFMFYKGGRYLIEPKEDSIWLKGTRFHCTKDELARVMEETPQDFSGNVILRPICQDSLLPTVVYVAGPSEIAYFAQLGPVYDLYEIPMPIIFPRASVTIVEEKIVHILEKYRLELKDFFVDLEMVSRRVAEKVSEIKVEEHFGRIGHTVDEIFSELNKDAEKLDPSLAGAVATAMAKIDYQFKNLKEKMIGAQKRKNEIAVRHVEKVAAFIYPRFALQERQLNVLYFMNKHGLDFVKWLQHEIEVERFGHQVIRL